ncbi:MAG: arsenic-transporting ATPase [Proteobacteria bacterium]|nr:MAG: arsenic-transporting ATPase [Pseudomonadota bacterium]
MRLVFYTGKGGVGKTTTAAATAAHAAARGHRTLVVSADPAHSLGDVLGVAVGGEAGRPTEVAPRLAALEVDARATLDPHWGRIRDYLVELFRHQGIEGVVADELALLPGAEEIAALLAVEEAARSRRYDVCVVDCAPTGSTLRLVTLPEVASRALRLLLRVQRAVATVVSPVARVVVPVPLPGPEVFRDVDQLLYERLAKLRELLLGDATSVRIVVTPERMVIDEALRAHTDLALFELGCDAVVMNRLFPPAAAAEAFFEGWSRWQEERLAEVEASFAPLPVLRASLADDEVIGVEALAAHGARTFGDADPAARLCAAPRLRFGRGKGEYRVELPLPHARKDALDVAKVDDALVVRTGNRRRAIPLPRKLAAATLVGAKLDAGTLVVRLAPAASGAR